MVSGVPMAILVSGVPMAILVHTLASVVPMEGFLDYMADMKGYLDDIQDLMADMKGYVVDKPFHLL